MEDSRITLTLKSEESRVKNEEIILSSIFFLIY